MRVRLYALAIAAAFLILSGFRPGTLPYTPGAPFSDAVTSHLPAAEFLRQSVLDDGAFPVWRETLFAGQPFAADPLNKTAYPLQWLALIFPPVLHLDLMIALHLLIAGAGMWAWARSFGLRDSAAGLSAVAYVLAPRLIGHTGAGHLDLVYALAWFPWLMWSIGQGGARCAVPLRRLLLLALFGALILLADLRLSLFAYALAGAYAIYEALRLRQPRQLMRFVLPLLLIAVLTLSLTLPLLGWRPYLTRGDLTSQDAGVFSLTPAQFLGLILPPRGGNVETLTYLGIPVLALAILGAVTARKWFWAAAAGIAALYALGINAPFWSLLVRLIPALLWFRVPSRAWFVVALIAPLLAGFGAEWLLDHRSQRGVLIALIGGAVALSGGVFLALSVPAINGAALAVGGGGLAAIYLLASSGRLRGEPLAWALIGVTALDLAVSGGGWLEWRMSDAWLPADQVQLAERLTQLGAYRVYSPTYSLQQQVAEGYHLRLFGGVDPFQLSGLVAAVEQGGGISGAGYSVVVPPLTGDDRSLANHDATPDTATLGRWGVTHVVSAYPLDLPQLEPLDVIGGIYLYANRDPALQTHFDGVPAWASGDLPDPQTVAELNRLTEIAALISGAALFGVLAVMVKVRH